MDGRKTQLPSWEEAIQRLREQAQHTQADAIEAAIKEGRKVQAIKLLRSMGISLKQG